MHILQQWSKLNVHWPLVPPPPPPWFNVVDRTAVPDWTLDRSSNRHSQGPNIDLRGKGESAAQSKLSFDHWGTLSRDISIEF